MIDAVQREVRGSTQHRVAKRIEAASWGSFFVWVGIALLIDVSIGVGLLGVGVIVLMAQAARANLGLSREGFWILVGFAFLATGTWRVLDIDVPLAPVLFIAVGALFLVGALRRRG